MNDLDANSLVPKILAYLGTTKSEILSCELVCKSWRRQSSLAWEEFAQRRYGKDVADATVALYNGNWRAMVADDNRLGALPTLEPGFQFVIDDEECSITQVKWNRVTNEIRVYCIIKTRSRPEDCIEIHGRSELRDNTGRNVLAWISTPVQRQQWTEEIAGNDDDGEEISYGYFSFHARPQHETSRFSIYSLYFRGRLVHDLFELLQNQHFYERMTSGFTTDGKIIYTLNRSPF